MKTNIKVLSAILFMVAVSYGLALLWWRGWMYQGFIGPLPFLHWVVQADGEGSYFLTELEMFFHLALLLLAGYFSYVVKDRKAARCKLNT